MILFTILKTMCLFEILLHISVAAESQLHQHQSQCAPGQFYINDHLHPGCYPIVPLEGECDFDVQCNAAVAYSFCRWEDENHRSRPKCTCFDGFAPTLNGHCHPVDRCHLQGFNAYMLQADCSKENQFCRYGHCLCKPGYAYEQVTEECLPLPKKTTKNSYNGQLKNLKRIKNCQNDEINQNNQLKRMKLTFQKTQFAIVTMMLILIVVLLGSLLALIYIKRSYFNQKLNSKTNLNANSKFVKKAFKENTLISVENGTRNKLKNYLPLPYFDQI